MTFVAGSNRVPTHSNTHSSLGFRVDADLTPIVRLESGRLLELGRLDRNLLPGGVENLLYILMPFFEVRRVHLMSFVEVDLQANLQRLLCNFALLGRRLFRHCASRTEC